MGSCVAVCRGRWRRKGRLRYDCKLGVVHLEGIITLCYGAESHCAGGTSFAAVEHVSLPVVDGPETLLRVLYVMPCYKV